MRSEGGSTRTIAHGAGFYDEDSARTVSRLDGTFHAFLAASLPRAFFDPLGDGWRWKAWITVNGKFVDGCRDTG